MSNSIKLFYKCPCGTYHKIDFGTYKKLVNGPIKKCYCKAIGK